MVSQTLSDIKNMNHIKKIRDNTASFQESIIEGTKIALVTTLVVSTASMYATYRANIDHFTNTFPCKFRKDLKKNDILINTEDTIINTNGFLSFFLSGGTFLTSSPEFFINNITYEKFKLAYKKIKIDQDINIRIKTKGGSTYYANLICKIINKHKGKVTAYIDEYASSAGTLIALSCDEIVMSENAALGMIDPQFYFNFKYYSAKEVLNINQSDKDRFEDNLLRESAKNIINTSRSDIKLFLKKNYSEEQIKNITVNFFDADNCHSKQMFFSEVKNILGDKVKIK